MSGLKQVYVCWDMSWGVTYAASAQCYSVRVTACQVSLCVSSQQSCCSFMTTRQCTWLQNLKLPFSNVWFQQLNHPPHSPDLAPSDYFLLRVMKKFLRGKRFSSDEEVKEAVTTWFEEQSKDFFLQADKVVAQKWAKCIELLGGYIEK